MKIKKNTCNVLNKKIIKYERGKSKDNIVKEGKCKGGKICYGVLFTKNINDSTIMET